MPTDDAVAAFVGVELTLPTGQTIHAKPLPWRLALELNDALDHYRERVQADGPAALQTYLKPLVERFLAAVQPEPADAVDALMLGELADLIRFFPARRPVSPAPVTPPRETPTPSA